MEFDQILQYFPLFQETENRALILKTQILQEEVGQNHSA
jgi:hypothetical protein